MSWARCNLCPDPDTAWEQYRPTREAADKALAAHQHLRHAMPPLDGVKQLDNVSWQETFLDAVRSVHIGTELTTADLHALVPAPPHHNAWGAATSRAAHLGLIREVGRQPSELATTKSSLVRRWVRVEPGVRAS